MPKVTPKGSPESQKVALGTGFFVTKKRIDFRKVFFSDLVAPGGPGTSKIPPKHCRVSQNRGANLFQKNLNFSQKRPQSEPQSDPRNHRKPKKSHPEITQKRSWKTHIKNTKQKHVLAREREARFKVESCGSMFEMGSEKFFIDCQ